MLTDTLRLTVKALPATCCCREFHINKVLFAMPECAHTNGQSDPALAVPYDVTGAVAEAKAWVAAQKALASGAARQGPAETVPAVDAPGTPDHDAAGPQ